MATGESEAVFDSYGVNPQLFVNEVWNAVDEVVDQAFDFYLRQAPEVLGGGVGSSVRSEDLERQVSTLHSITQAVLDKQLTAWENYCLRNCFVVPEGFSLQTTDIIGNNSLSENLLNDSDLDNQIQSLRDKLVTVERESSELQREIQSLERKAASVSTLDAAVAEVFKEYKVHGLLQEIKKTAPMLNLKVQELGSRRDDLKYFENGRLLNCGEAMDCNLGFSSRLDDIHKVLDLLKNV